MLIGRTDDPQNPCRVAACKVSNPFGCGSRNPSGPAAIVPRQTGRTHDRNRTRSDSFASNPLASRGPFSNRSSFVKTPFTSPARVMVLFAVSARCRNIWSGPEDRHCKVHNGLTFDHAPTGPPRNCLHPRPGAMRVGGVFDEF